MKFKILYYGKMSDPLGKVLNFISWFGAICLSLSGSVLTVISGSPVPVFVCTPSAIAFFFIFQNLSITAENKAKKEEAYEESVLTEKTFHKDKVTFNTYVTFGEAMIMTNSTKGITKTIVKNHEFQNFPGMKADEKWLSEWTSQYPPANWVRYRTEIMPQENGSFLLLWEIQPDGRYWADEGGYGWENDKDICLYSTLDEKGTFLHPFRLYSIGGRSFYTI